jgi:NodT family efflux transporter outer membrane factor (OMF) lipoprotein
MIRVGGARIAAAAMLLSACTVGPHYQVPTPPEGAQGPLVSTSPAAETVDATADRWWHLYHDDRLDGYLDEAFAANTDLKAAEANLTAARAILEGVKAERYPATKAEAGGTYGRDPVTEETLSIVGHAPENLWIFDSLLDVSYEVDLFGRVRRSVEAARADTAANAAARDAIKITVAAETARAYAQVCALGEQLSVAQRSLDIVTHEAGITVQRHEAGANSEFDVVRAQGLVAQVRAGVPPLVGQRRAALYQLAALLGRTPARAPEDAMACLLPPKLDTLIPVGDGAALLKRRPDVRQAERRLAAATARIGVATADLYPRISLTGFYGGVATNFTDLSSNVARASGIGPSISWTFPNQALPRARIRQARANATAALASFDGSVLQALKETEQALATYGAELERRQALSDAQANAQKAFDLAHDQFINGALSNLDLLTTEQVLVAVDASVAVSDTALIQDQIAVFKALGGGWN